MQTDPRFIAVPDGFINLIPTDVRGITFNRAPQQVGEPTQPVQLGPRAVPMPSTWQGVQSACHIACMQHTEHGPTCGPPGMVAFHNPPPVC